MKTLKTKLLLIATMLCLATGCSNETPKGEVIEEKYKPNYYFKLDSELQDCYIVFNDDYSILKSHKNGTSWQNATITMDSTSTKYDEIFIVSKYSTNYLGYFVSNLFISEAPDVSSIAPRGIYRMLDIEYRGGWAE